MIVGTGLSENYVFGRKTALSGLPTTGTAVELDPPQENFTTMDDLAEATGGRAFYNANDIDVSIRRAIDDSRDTYVLSYYPAIAQWDGELSRNQSGGETTGRSGSFTARILRVPGCDAGCEPADPTDGRCCVCASRKRRAGADRTSRSGRNRRRAKAEGARSSRQRADAVLKERRTVDRSSRSGVGANRGETAGR